MATLTSILLIDDDAVDRQAVRRALAASNLTWELTEAASGAEGLARAMETVFDCVLLDYRLPDVDAFQLLADLLTAPANRQAVMMLTGDADPETALSLMRAGALDYLAKSEMNPQMLARAIRYARARRSFLSELEEKSYALDALNRQKSLLLSIIAHDLRNPFQVILGMSEALSQAVAGKDPARIELRAQGIHQAAGQAYKLMEDLFSWTQLQMDSPHAVLEAIELQGLVESAIDPTREAAGSKAIYLSVDCGNARVRSQKDMLTTIVRNLVGNAIKFTHEGGRVTISASVAEKVILKISDTGVGMTAETLNRLFQLDHRLTTIGTAGERGGGLGLLLCRDLAERIGAVLEVVSAPGDGTTFSLHLPRE